MIKVKIMGYKEAKAILDELPNNMQKRMLNAALRSSARPMLRSAQGKVPTRTGRLRKMLRIVRFRDRSAPKTEVAVALKHVFGKNKKSGTINQYYGKWVHEGTMDLRSSRTKKILVFENAQGKKIFTRSVKGIKATPYIERAYQENYNRTVTMFGDELAKHVEKFVKRNFKPAR